jgi:hypothetical protein
VCISRYPPVTAHASRLWPFCPPAVHKPAMAEMDILRPFHELEVPHQHRLQPPALCHFGGGKPRTPATGLFLGQIGERAFLNFQRFDSFEQRGARCRSESVSGPRGVYQLVAVIIADDQCVEILGRCGVTGDDEFTNPECTSRWPRTRRNLGPCTAGTGTRGSDTASWWPSSPVRAARGLNVGVLAAIPLRNAVPILSG